MQKDFYNDVKEWYLWALNNAKFPFGIPEEHLLRFLTKMIFIWFLKEKKLIPEKLFDERNNYYNTVIKNIFEAIKNPIEDRQFNFTDDINMFNEIPFIGTNVVLHADNFELPDFLFFEDKKGLINIFKKYTFTIDESNKEVLNPSILGRIYENFLAFINHEQEQEKTARKITGSYYTPNEIVDFMVEEAILEYIKTNTNIAEDKLRQLITTKKEIELNNNEKEEIIKAINKVKILEPAVGAGAFAIGALDKLVYILSKIDKDKTNYEKKLYFIQNSIYGVDIQSVAIQITKLRLYLSLLLDKNNFEIIPLTDIKLNFIVANTLIDFNPELLFNIKDGFDIVIGNPPYVRQEKIKDIKEILKKQGYEVFTSTADLYVYFYEKGIKLLKDRGILSYITSNKWFRAKYGENLRKYLKENTKIIKIIDFSGYKIFKQTVDTNIIILQKEKPTQDWEFEYVEVKGGN